MDTKKSKYKVVYSMGGVRICKKVADDSDRMKKVEIDKEVPK